MNRIRDETIKWYSVTEYVDVETGEIISKSLKEREYITIKKTKTIEIKEAHKNEKFGIIKWQYECRRNPQGKLWK